MQNINPKTETGSILIVIVLIAILSIGAAYVYINTPQIDSTHMASEVSSNQ